MDYKYSFNNLNKETMARALGRGIPISVKHGVELANAIRGMSAVKAKKFLEDVMKLDQPVKYRRFNDDLGHKKKCGPARYPVKTATYFLGILKLAESNASFQGISTNDLKIIHISVQKAAGRWHFGRKRRRKFKSAHVELVLEECPPAGRKPAAKKEKVSKPEAKPKAEVKPEVAKKPNAEAKPVEAKPDVKAEAKPVAKADVKMEMKKEVKAEAKPAPKVIPKEEGEKK
ncbi:MAG: 50S ribosomal protein L22 [Nanoarchaeota archaeon]|nr:50S ribosomal protein L22 [Nanoarchaeota archaeon]